MCHGHIHKLRIIKQMQIAHHEIIVPAHFCRRLFFHHAVISIISLCEDTVLFPQQKMIGSICNHDRRQNACTARRPLWGLFTKRLQIGRQDNRFLILHQLLRLQNQLLDMMITFIGRPYFDINRFHLMPCRLGHRPVSYIIK